MQSIGQSPISPFLARTVRRAAPSNPRVLTGSCTFYSAAASRSNCERTSLRLRARIQTVTKAAHIRPRSLSTSRFLSTSTTTSTAYITERSRMYKHAEIIAKLDASFEKAKEAGDLLFFPSSVHTHSENGVDFQIRLCPALQKKPTTPAPDLSKSAQGGAGEDAGEKEKKRHDPFAPPYVPNLFLGEVRDESEGNEYVLLFNKYSVVPHHFMLVSKEFRSQTSPLLPSDLVQTYLFLIAARNAGRKFFAFYNCGDLSGASQPHKHIQLLPLDDDGPPVEKLARTTKLDKEDRPFSIDTLPYANHVRRLPSALPSLPLDGLEASLTDAFLSVLDLAIQTARHDPTYPPGIPSHNVFLALEHVHVVPRRREAYTLPGTGEALSVNALGFAGMLLVKSERELGAVREEGVGKILRGVGLEGGLEAQVDEHRHADDRVAVADS